VRPMGARSLRRRRTWINERSKDRQNKNSGKNFSKAYGFTKCLVRRGRQILYTATRERRQWVGGGQVNGGEGYSSTVDMGGKSSRTGDAH